MKRVTWLASATLALGSTLAVAQNAPESLLPPGFDDPISDPAPAPRSTAAPSAPDRATSGTPVVQEVPQGESSLPEINLPADFPSLAEIEQMTTAEVDELLGLRPKYDIPPGARRSLARAGVVASTEGGFPSGSFRKQPAALVAAALKGTQGPLVSRWGHILLRRTLASRLTAPSGMAPAEFAALRADLLNRMGESTVARALVQDIDTAEYSRGLVDAAFDAYVATGDIVGMCPAARLMADIRDDPQWQMVRSICAAFAGDRNGAKRELDRALSRGIAPRIDILLAQRFAGAGGDGGQAVTIEWDEVEELTPWRYSLASALGLDIPDSLLGDASRGFARMAAVAPFQPLTAKVEAADIAASEGILSATAMVDLYSQIYLEEDVSGPASVRASRLRESYVGGSPAIRLAAIKDVWGDATNPDYGRQVLTAYAAARMPPDSEFADGAGPLIASMLAAGLDRNALRWESVVSQGSLAWALLAVARIERGTPVSAGALDSFIDDDASQEMRKSAFLLAGLAGLGRLDEGAVADAASRLNVDLGRETRWSRAIMRAAELDNQALVALLAGLGMQGDSWSRMTARHLYYIVAALDRVGLSAEARMIAAEAVARG